MNAPIQSIQPNPPHHLWLDKPDAPEKIKQLLEEKIISSLEADLFNQFCEDGYFILPQFFNGLTIWKFRRELKSLYKQQEKYLVRRPRPKEKRMEIYHPNQAVLHRFSRLLDIYVNSKNGREIALCNPLTRLLTIMYEEPPLAFQSLLFTWGTNHELHTDNAFIVADPACSIISSWVALEDIKKGAGEVAFYPGSHKEPLYLFNEEHIAWIKDRDGVEDKRNYVKYLEYIADKRKAEEFTFLGKKGDVIIWHANLLHYGTKVKTKNRTRYSMLTHYCPASATPNYFNFFQQAHKKPYKNGFYSSRRYDLRDGINNPYPVFKG